MSTAVLLAPPRYSLLLTRDDDLIEAAQRLRHQVFTTEPGFTLTGAPDGRDADHFDEHCDHLLVRDDSTGELVGCYRMLPPQGALAAGGLYAATEFDVRELEPLRPSLVEMGRAVVHPDHRNGAVVLMMWTGILAYLDRCGYDYVSGCVSVPVEQVPGVRAAAQRWRDPQYTVHPHRPVPPGPDIGGGLPPLLRGYLRLGARICGEPAHDPAFGVGDFPALLDKRRADRRYLARLRSMAQR
jgi:putative hemolysin